MIYTDGGEGASFQCVAMAMDSLKSALKSLASSLPGGPYVVDTTTTAEIRSGEWMASCCLLVMPGGRDLPYVKELAGQGNDYIRQFVLEGGSYLGLCAGAYYACKRVEFAVGDPTMEVVGPRELAFFPGIGRGPVFPGYDYKSNRGARAASVTLEPAGEKIVQETYPTPISPTIFPLYYNGGCNFVPFDDHPSTQFEVLATYTGKNAGSTVSGSENLSAIVSCKCGKGKAVLTGVHFEVTAKLLVQYHDDDEYIKPLLPQLEDSEPKREKLLNSFVKYLLNQDHTLEKNCNTL